MRGASAAMITWQNPQVRSSKVWAPKVWTVAFSLSALVALVTSAASSAPPPARRLRPLPKRAPPNRNVLPIWRAGTSEVASPQSPRPRRSALRDWSWGVQLRRSCCQLPRCTTPYGPKSRVDRSVMAGCSRSTLRPPDGTGSRLALRPGSMSCEPERRKSLSHMAMARIAPVSARSLILRFLLATTRSRSRQMRGLRPECLWPRQHELAIIASRLCGGVVGGCRAAGRGGAGSGAGVG